MRVLWTASGVRVMAGYPLGQIIGVTFSYRVFIKSCVFPNSLQPISDMYKVSQKKGARFPKFKNIPDLLSDDKECKIM